MRGRLELDARADRLLEIGGEILGKLAGRRARIVLGALHARGRDDRRLRSRGGDDEQCGREELHALLDAVRLFFSLDERKRGKGVDGMDKKSWEGWKCM